MLLGSWAGGMLRGSPADKRPLCAAGMAAAQGQSPAAHPRQREGDTAGGQGAQLPPQKSRLLCSGMPEPKQQPAAAPLPHPSASSARNASSPSPGVGEPQAGQAGPCCSPAGLTGKDTSRGCWQVGTRRQAAAARAQQEHPRPNQSHLPAPPARPALPVPCGLPGLGQLRELQVWGCCADCCAWALHRTGPAAVSPSKPSSLWQGTESKSQVLFKGEKEFWDHEA